MAFEGMGTYWSDEPAVPRHDLLTQGLQLGVAAGVGATAFAYGVQTRPDGTRRIDDLVRFSRTLGNLSPFQIGNTFRVPEFLSPFTSPAYQKLSPAGGGLRQMSIGQEFLGNKNTYTYLQKLTGMNNMEMEAAGLTRGMQPTMNGGALASELVFEKAEDAINGSLYSVVNGERRLLSANTMLMAFTGETPNITDLTTKNQPINKAVKSVFAAMNMWGEGGFAKVGDENSVFSHRDPTSVNRPGFIPIPGIDASARGTTFLRSLPAFSMERFNNLLNNVGEEVLGPTFTRTLQRTMGIKTGVLPGPSSSMYARFGMKGLGLLGAGLAIGELDWVRRQGGLTGQVGASAITSFGIGAIAARAGMGARGAFFAGLASFAGQMILPGFDQGVLPGIASTYAGISQLKSIPMNPFSLYRRTAEGFLPGISSPGLGVLTGVGLVAAANMRVPGTGQKLPNILLEKFGAKTFGLSDMNSLNMPVRAPKTVRDHFWDQMVTWSEQNVGGADIAGVVQEYQKLGGYSTFGMRNRLMRGVYNSGMANGAVTEHMNKFWAIAEERYNSLQGANPVNQALKDRLADIELKYSGKGDFVSKAMMQVEGVGEQFRHAFFGAELAEEGMSQFMRQKGFRSFLGKTGMLFATGFLAQQFFTGGLLGSMEGWQEKKDVLAGRQLVEVEKGRFWELGGTPWEGTGTGVLRPHWYPIMMNRVKQRGTWGEKEDQLSPTMKFLASNFTYELERRTYYDRPYPISSPAFSNIPIIGPALGATIGQVFKPAKLMHAGEWIRSQNGNMEFASVYEGWKREPAYNLGAHDPGIPRSPYDSGTVFAELNYHFRDLSGLTGWATNMVQNMIVGEDTFFGSSPRLAESGMMTSYRKAFWDQSLGGLGPLGEIVRRAVPSFSNDYERVNPIINNMPTWLPTSLKFGDPYSKFPLGEAMLPGAGYSALHPELASVDPEDYPLIYRYDILAQVSPRSKQFRQTRDMLYQQRAMGYLNPAQEAWVDRIDSVASKQWNIKEFDRVHDNAIQLPGSSITRAAWFTAQKALRKAVAPAEYLIPGGFRPVQKFLGDRDAIEQYEYERMYGSTVAFWDKPFRDWLRPSVYSLANFMGWQGKPLWRVQADNTNQYFDQIEFTKWMTLAEQAREAGHTRDQIRYEYQAANTRMGVNPQGNPLSIYWTLPQEDRAFFNAFAFAQGKDRKRILKMVPEDQVHLYQTLWSRMDSDDPRLWAGGDTGPDGEYLRQQFYSLQQDMPPVDWIGWHQDVDISDVKVRYINELATDMRDYGHWEKELDKAYSQPFLDGSTGVFHDQKTLGRGAMLRDMHELLRGNYTGPDISMFGTNSTMGTTQLEYGDNREGEILEQMGGWLNVQ